MADDTLQSVAPSTMPPIYGDPGQPSEPSTFVPSGAPAPQTQQPKTGLWQTVLQGALSGLAGSAGTTSFGGGLAGGAKGYIQEQQREIENTQRAQQLKFESVRAADSHTLALAQATAADNASEASKISMTNQMRQANEWADEHGQPHPYTISSENPNGLHAQASGALPNLANSNGGAIPGVTITQSPSMEGDKDHRINIYAPTISDVRSNPNAMADAINTVNQIKAGSTQVPKLTPQDILIQGGQAVKGNASAGAAQLWREAQAFMIGLPKLGSDAENASTSAGLKEQLNRYKKNPDYQESTGKLLQTQLDSFNAAAKDQSTQTGEFKKNEMAITAAQELNDAVAKQAALLPGDIKEARQKAEVEAKVKQMYDNKPVYAVDSTGKTVLTTQAAANANSSGYTAVRPVKESDIRTDQRDIKVLNDIQLKSDAVKSAASAMDSTSWAKAVEAANYLASHPDSTITSLKNAKILKDGDAAQNKMNQYIINILSLRESAMGLQKVLTGSARNNDKQIIALQNTLPGFESSSGIVGQKLNAFDQNLSMLSQGLPENTGVAIQVKPISKPLSISEAHEYLQKAGGDKDKARALATADGRSF